MQGVDKNGVLALSVCQPLHNSLALFVIAHHDHSTDRAFFFYAPLKAVAGNLKIWSRDLGMPTNPMPDCDE